jgi:tetratricopeptide (TPR) repeat protein
MNTNRKLFLSAVSSEFESYRRLLAADLKRPTLDVAVQEDFGVGGGLTLDKLDDYLRACDGVVHLIGKATGAVPEAVAVQDFIARRCPDLATRVPSLASALAQSDPGFSYTQWEAYLAIYHRRELFIYRPTDFESATCHCPREPRFVLDPAQEQSQRAHYQRLCDLGRDRGLFANPERLSSAVLRDLVEILPRLETRLDVPPTRLRHTAGQLVGRDAELNLLDEAWNNPHINLVVIRGKGGEGKTALVAAWMAELAAKDWRGAERVLDWSFYSQGTRDQASATSEVFIHDALEHLGDPDPNAGDAAARAGRLACLIGDQRCLLVLDGLEPLQYPPGPLHGALKDPGMAALLRGLVARNAGLCVVTTRERVEEIQQHYGQSAVDHELKVLSPLAGAHLLHNAGARRAGAQPIAADDAELQQASREVRGHALTLSLMGQYLHLTAGGDIRQRDRMKLADADKEYTNDTTRPYGHAFKAIEAYERWFADGGPAARRQLALLRLLGLFDRPAPAACLGALRDGKAIPGLTDAWAGASPKDWSIALSRLQEINLVGVSEEGAVDCHPLLREYFAARLKERNPAAFRAAHARLFEHLCATTEHRPDTLPGLQPLYQAVTHGCLAGRQQEACDKVFKERIRRGNEVFSTKKLGAVGANLGAVAAFFDEPWTRLSPSLRAPDQAWLLNEAAFHLRALGRLTEAVEPMRVSTDRYIADNQWRFAARAAGNLSELEVTLGRLRAAVDDARRAIEFADRSGDAAMKMITRTTAADALHQAGERAEAGALFAEAERMQAESQPQFPLLYSARGFKYADLLLAPAERAAWRKMQESGVRSQKSELDAAPLAACAEAERRVAKWFEWRMPSDSMLDIALDHLTQARAALYRALLTRDSSFILHPLSFSDALTKLRAANSLDDLPRALLTAAHYHGTLGGDAAEARRVLDEAQKIAERGPMPLHLADVHLHRARLFRDRAELAKARALIEEYGYARRRDELADADAISAGWKQPAIPRNLSPDPMKTTPAPSVARTAFISHSTADDGYVAELESFLRASGFQEVFNDVSSIKPDEKFWPEIEKGIRGCEVFYCVIGEKTKDSDWVRREVELARSLSKTIVPVWIEGDGVPAFFEGRDVVDFRARKRQEEGTKERLIAEATAGMTSEQLLNFLGGLNRAMFAEVLFHFDPKNQIPGGELSQRERAMELIKLTRAQDGGLAKLILFVAKLRGA